MREFKITDTDGDVVVFEEATDERGHATFVETGPTGAYLTDEDLREIRDAIDEHLGDRTPTSVGTVTIQPVLAEGALDQIREEIESAISSIRLTLRSA